jgi:hypothetical protein
MDEIVITRLLVSATAYQHGQALEEFSPLSTGSKANQAML